jgi:tetratricopeptide (TPR) repeat protein
LLLVRGIAEAAAVVATANGASGTAERKAFLTAVCAAFGLDETTATYLGRYFDKCTAGKAEGLLQAFREACTEEYKRLALRVALSVAQADGFVDENETRVLRNLAELLGLDPNKVYKQMDTGTVGNGIGEPWWEVLAVSSRASIDEVTFAYRKLAMQFHPDVWGRASESQRQAADARMKRINIAFDRAKRDIHAREKHDAAATAAARKSAAAKPTVERREKEQKKDTHQDRARDGPVGKPAEKEEKAAEAISAIPSRPAASSAAKEPAASPASFVFLALAISVIIAVVGTVFFLNQNGSTQRSVSPVANKATASLPDPSPPGNDAPDAAGSARGNPAAPLPEPPLADDTDATDYYQQAAAKADRGDYAGAVVLLNRAIAIEPNAVKLYTDRGIYYCKLDNLDQAATDLTKAIEIEPNRAKPYHNRGVVRLLQGEFDLAIHDFDTAIRLEPTYSAAYANRDLAIQKKREMEHNAYVPAPQRSAPRITVRDAVDRNTAIQSSEEYYRKRAAMKRGGNSP